MYSNIIQEYIICLLWSYWNGGYRGMTYIGLIECQAMVLGARLTRKRVTNYSGNVFMVQEGLARARSNQQYIDQTIINGSWLQAHGL